MRHPLTLTSQAGEVLTLSVPTSWADVSLQQFLDWQVSERPAIECLAGISTEQLHRLAASDAGYLLNLLAFAVALPDPPVTPGLKDVGEASYGQMVLATQYLQAHPDQPLIWYAPYLYALYRSREQKGAYDEAHVVELEAWVRAQPVDVVLGDVLFTEAAWLDSFRTMPRTPPMPPSPTTTSSTPVWKRCWRGMGRFFRSTRWPSPSA